MIRLHLSSVATGIDAAPAPRRPGLGLPPLPARMAEFERRGFRAGRPAAREVLQLRARSFLHGYETARRQGIIGIDAVLDKVAPVNRGFAYEGAAFAAAAADLLPSWRRRRGSRLVELLALVGDRFPHLIHVGAGWFGLLAPVTLVPRRAPLDPMLRWLAVDGAGFARAFLRGPRWITRLAAAPYSADPVRSVLYQGVGRSLWFVDCADVDAVQARIETFPLPARTELWAGIGLAACYAGGADERSLTELAAMSGPGRYALAQGAAFAAGARLVGQHVPAHTRAAVLALAGVAVETATKWTIEATPPANERDGTAAAYRNWQNTIRALASQNV